MEQSALESKIQKLRQAWTSRKRPWPGPATGRHAYQARRWSPERGRPAPAVGGPVTGDFGSAVRGGRLGSRFAQAEVSDDLFAGFQGCGVQLVA